MSPQPATHLRPVPDPAPVTAELDGAHRSVVVVGGGQAGLSVSRWLTRHGLDHLVLEAKTAGHEWRDRR
ncbi:FAD-dependent monooxygenase, partial [Pseudonocardia sp. RS010]|uniref:FAD-dependent monooxygenase n=1 Tax=Pseudonocardia sp. RS010 TaxID=3385979 RepID=UPI0039A2E72B